jgi:hypothetical protein
MANDRRQSPRVHSLHFVAEEGQMLRTLDVSGEGMLLEMGNPAPLGSRLELSVAFKEVILPLHGEVVRHELLKDRRIGVGIHFVDLTEAAHRALEAEATRPA